MRIHVVLCALAVALPAAAQDLVVAEGRTVRMDYTLTLEDGTVADTSIGRQPLAFVQGKHQIIPGLEAAIEGMRVEETKKVVVAPENAYGAVSPEAFREVRLDQIPEDHRYSGAVLTGQAPTGESVQVRVHEVREDVVVVDFNHPMAGKTLTFDVKIVGIE